MWERTRVWALSALAACLFVPLFATRGAPGFDFWWWMAGAIVLAVGLAARVDPGFVPALRADLGEGVARKIAGGLAAAVVLYGVFWAGNLASRAVLSRAGADIEAVYGFKEGASTARIVILMAIVIGPGEELLWRACLQRGLCGRLGPSTGLLAATALYAGVHLATGNVILVLAALVCGLFWGQLYLRYRSIIVNAVSHTAWDLAAFVFLPFT